MAEAEQVVESPDAVRFDMKVWAAGQAFDADGNPLDNEGNPITESETEPLAGEESR